MHLLVTNWPRTREVQPWSTTWSGALPVPAWWPSACPTAASLSCRSQTLWRSMPHSHPLLLSHLVSGSLGGHSECWTLKSRHQLYKHRLLVSRGVFLKFFTKRKSLNSVRLRKCVAMDLRFPSWWQQLSLVSYPVWPTCGLCCLRLDSFPGKHANKHHHLLCFDLCSLPCLGLDDTLFDSWLLSVEKIAVLFVLFLWGLVTLPFP